jgi:chromosome transmission fidelity protein 18
MEAMHIPAAAGVAHVLCRVEQKQNLVYSLRELSDARQQKEASEALVQRFAHRSWQASLIPYILWILSAGEGSSALQKAATSVELLSKEEKRAFDAHVANLVSLGLTYVVDENTFDNLPTMRLEPPIDKLAQFMDLGSTRPEVSQAVRDDACSRVVFYATDLTLFVSQMKELLARAVVHEKLKNRRIHREISSPVGKPAKPSIAMPQQHQLPAESNKVDTNIAKKRESGETTSDVPAKRPKVPAVVDFLVIGARKAKEARSARNAARVGIQRSKRTRLSHTGSGLHLTGVVRLKYVKGFTQAVRTPCQLDELV